MHGSYSLKLGMYMYKNPKYNTYIHIMFELTNEMKAWKQLQTSS